MTDECWAGNFADGGGDCGAVCGGLAVWADAGALTVSSALGMVCAEPWHNDYGSLQWDRTEHMLYCLTNW